MIIGSVYVTFGALLIGVPIGILTALFLAFFCKEKWYPIFKRAVSLMAGIPSVVYGFFGLVVLVPFVRNYVGGHGMGVLTASILLGIMIYYKEIQKADEMLKEKREQIEEELYRFVSTITQELKNSRDVLSMLEHYKENAGAAFRKELDIVCADMRSSSYEAALTRFEARLNSPQLSDVVRGLIGVLRGDDGAVYFQMLTHDFKQTELQRLKAKAAKIPPKIRVYSFAMLMCFLATYFAIIIYEIIRSMGTLF